MVAGATPFVVGRLLPLHALSHRTLCPLKRLTRIPCPMCGTTRAFVLASHGDRRFAMEGNPVWVAVAAAACASGFAGLIGLGPRAIRDPASARPSERELAFIGVPLLAFGWITALRRRL